MYWIESDQLMSVQDPVVVKGRMSCVWMIVFV